MPTYWVLLVLGCQEPPQILVAKALQQMLTSQNDPEQAGLILADRSQSTIRTALLNHPPAHRVEHLLRRGRSLHHRQRLQVALIRRPADFDTPGGVGQALAHGNPAHAGLALPGRFPKHLEHAGIIDRRLDPQYAPLFVVHLDRIVADPVLDPNPFGSVEKARGHFSVEPRGDAAAKEPQDIPTQNCFMAWATNAG